MASGRLVLVWGVHDQIGGTERRMLDVVTPLQRDGAVVTAIIHGGGQRSRLAVEFAMRGAAVSSVRTWREAMRTLIALEADAVVTFGIKPSLATRAACAVEGVRRRRTPVVIMARNGLDFGWPTWLHLVDRLTSRGVDSYLVNSGAVAEHLERWGIKPDLIDTIVGGLEPAWCAPRQRLQRPGLVAMIGNDRPEKNHTFGIDGFLAANLRGPLRIYTNDARRVREHVQRLCDRYSSEALGRIEFAEGRELKPVDFDEIDVLLHPSLSESLPRVVLEAQARGCRVVASAVGALPTAVDRQGLLFEVDSLTALVEALTQIDARSHPSVGQAPPHVRTVDEYALDLERLLQRLCAA